MQKNSIYRQALREFFTYACQICKIYHDDISENTFYKIPIRNKLLVDQPQLCQYVTQSFSHLTEGCKVKLGLGLFLVNLHEMDFRNKSKSEGVTISKIVI